jgi:CheY-like chemotaxis protein
MSGFRPSGWRRFCFELRKIGESDLDQRAYPVLDSGLARERERLLVALADLRRVHSLLEAIVPREQCRLDTNTGVVPHPPKPYCKPTRVLIADDERLFVDALELILAADDRIEVVGRALDGREAVVLARELEPDVVLMDLSMPGIDGFAAIAAIVADEITRRIVVLSGSADPGDIDKAREAGAVAYLMKDRIADELVPGVLAAAAA